MKKSELKEIIKPIVEECVQESVREILLDSGLLSSVINEVVKGTLPLILENAGAKQTAQPVSKKTNPIKNELVEQLRREKEESIQEFKQQANSVENNFSFKVGGVDVFKGTKPAPESIKESIANPLGGVSPNDPGVDISKLFGGKKFNIG